MHTQNSGNENEESRLIYQNNGGLNELASQSIEAKGAKFSTWKDDTPGAEELFDYFAAQNIRKINNDHLKQYFLERAKNIPIDPKHLLQQLKLQYDVIEDVHAKPEDKLKAENLINTLVEFLQKRNDVLQQASEKLQHAAEVQEVPSIIEATLGTVKEHVGALGRGFMDASWKEKGIMIAGIAAMIYAVRKMMSTAEASKTFKPIKDTLGNVLGYGVTGAAAYMGFEAANKAMERTYGRPMFSWKGRSKIPSIRQTQEEWELDRVYAEMKSINIPVEEFESINKHSEKERFAFGIANLATMQADKFLSLYEKFRVGSQIPDDASEYPSHPFRKDLLSPLERFILVQDMGKALDLIDKQNGEPVQLSHEEKIQSILHFSVEAWEEERRNTKATGEWGVSDMSIY